jgi:hypothetical protein
MGHPLIMDTHIIRIKLLFVMLALLLLATIIVGIQRTRYTKTFTSANLQRIFSYPMYEIVLRSRGKGLLAAAAALLPDDTLRPGSGIDSADDIPVLVYHGIVETPDRFSLTPDAFTDHIRSLKQAGYHTITLAEL